MSMTYLSTKILSYYPSVQDLYDECRGSDPVNWGLCQNNSNTTAFREPNEEWLLQASLITLHDTAVEQYGSDCDLEDIIIYYEFTKDTANDDGGIKHVLIETVNLAYYEEAMREPFIPEIPTWLDS